ncbi:hypothetical protein QF042_002860 [Pedobacter sp. W3I1]|uniref:DUF4402 domain-containing protein n=1 Tax=Pedobacter sp. W3I1 TaxID=3042291 RepID=UPI00277D5FE0|nr:DUF4402 domain-containing protein [Pedobacter sp. W3I1]MDQ0639295.1 hypothetical protein [Pedobacter sp. W3I1]
MKKSIIAIGITLSVFCFVSSGFAQASATADASATIVTPISISKTADMNFGNVATNGAVGTVVLAPAGTRTSTGGVTVPTTVGTVTAASFTVSGSGAYTYAITLPSSVVITSGTDNMTVNTFTSTPATTGTLTAGTQIIKVGATLNLVASQAVGSYTSATPFTVTVNYN